MTTLGALIPAGVPKTGGSMGMLGPAIATGAAQVIGGWMGGKGASRAAKSQALAQQQALNYQRSRDAIEDQRYNARVEDYKKRYADFLARNGYPSTGGAAAPAGPSGPQTLGELAGAGIPSGEGRPTAADLQSVASQFGTLGGIASGAEAGGPDVGWNDWRRYGAGGQ